MLDGAVNNGVDKYYNQLKLVFWPRLKVGSSTVMLTVRIQQFLDSNHLAMEAEKDNFRAGDPQ